VFPRTHDRAVGGLTPLGVLDPELPVSPLLNSSEAAKDAPVRHFSAFPLTSHMHMPTLRLVSLHPLLSLTLSFSRVPEIHETFAWKVFFARASTTKDVINTVVEELGLTKTLPVPGAGTLEYVLEEVLEDGKSGPKTRRILSHPKFITGPTRLPSSASLSNILETTQKGSPANPPSYRFCVPDEWYRRSRTRTLSSGSLTPSEATMKRLADLEESEEEDEESAGGEGTAKAQAATTQSPASSPRKSGDWRGTFSQARLSTMFEGWLPSSPTPAAPVESAQNRRTSISVSDPIPVQAVFAGSDSDDLNEFEEMMVNRLYSVPRLVLTFWVGQSRIEGPKEGRNAETPAGPQEIFDSSEPAIWFNV
jgi:diaphanous 1